MTNHSPLSLSLDERKSIRKHKQQVDELWSTLHTSSLQEIINTSDLATLTQHSFTDIYLGQANTDFPISPELSREITKRKPHLQLIEKGEKKLRNLAPIPEKEYTDRSLIQPEIEENSEGVIQNLKKSEFHSPHAKSVFDSLISQLQTSLKSLTTLHNRSSSFQSSIASLQQLILDIDRFTYHDELSRISKQSYPLKSAKEYLTNIISILQESLAEQTDTYKDTKLAVLYRQLWNIHKQQAANGWLVVEGLASREKIVDSILHNILDRKNSVLTGPAGTGKTELAKYTVRKLLNMLMNREQISKEEFELLSQDVPALSGHPDATKNEFLGKIVPLTKQSPEQLSNIRDQAQDKPMFDFAMSKLELACKIGLPIIIDEFLRYPESALAYLKFFRSRKPWEKLTLSNGDQIDIKSVNFIGTTNRWEQYGLIPADYIAREFSPIPVDYIGGEELKLLVSAKLMYKPWYIPYVGASTFKENGLLDNLVKVIPEVEDLRFARKEQTYFSSKLNSAGDFMETKGTLNQALLDTKRFLELRNWDETERLQIIQDSSYDTIIAHKICDFISNQADIKDQCILLRVFSAKGLIDSQHEEYLTTRSKELAKKDKNNITLAKLNLVSTSDKVVKWNKGALQVTDITQLLTALYPSISKLPLSDTIHMTKKEKEIKKIIWLLIDEYGGDVSILTLLDVLDKQSQFSEEDIKKLITICQDQLNLDRDRSSTDTAIKNDNAHYLQEYDNNPAWWFFEQLNELLEDTSEQDKNQKIKEEQKQRAKDIFTQYEYEEYIEANNIVKSNANFSQLGQQRKAQALQFLKDNNLETPAHIAMINNVQFTKEAIVIGGVPRAHENAKASDFGLTYSVDNKDNPADYSKSHVFKGEGAYADEDYFNYAMVDKIVKEKQAKVPSYQDMRKTLAALPGGPSGTLPDPPSSIGRNVGSAKLMSILLGTEMSGCRVDGVWDNVGSYGCLWSRSGSDSDYAWACGWDETRGGLGNYNRKCAWPLRLLV